MNPDLVKTALDKPLWERWSRTPGPNAAKVTDEGIFHQDTADSAAVITNVNSGTGLWTQHTELDNVAQATPFSADKRTTYVLSWSKELPISMEFMEDNMWGAVEKQVRDMGDNAWLTDYKNAFALYRNAFTTTLTNNGVALVSDSQKDLNGGTVDNKGTAALSPSALYAGIVKLMEQPNLNGDIVGSEGPYTLLVPPALFKTACEITESVVLSADQEMNVFSAKYNLYVKQSNQLGAAAGGSDTAWFLLAANHDVYRFERKPMTTFYTPLGVSSNLSAKYTGVFRNAYEALTYRGTYGSLGTA